MSASEKVAQNTLLTAVARVAMALSIPILSAIGAFVYNMNGSIETLEVKVTILENDRASSNGQLARIEQKQDVIEDRIIQILQAIARLETKTGNTLLDNNVRRELLTLRADMEKFRLTPGTPSSPLFYSD